MVNAVVGQPGSEWQAIRDVDLEIDALLDRKTNIHVLGLYGLDTLEEQVPGAPAGVFKRPPTDVSMHISHRRTSAAREAGREWLGVDWSGLVDASCSIHA